MLIKTVIVLVLLMQVVPVFAVANAMLRQHNDNGLLSILLVSAAFLLATRYLWRRAGRKATRTR